MSDKDVPVSEVTPPNKLLKRGSIVSIKCGDGSVVDGEVTSVARDGKINCILKHRGQEMELTSVERDPTGTKPDTWNYKAA